MKRFTKSARPRHVRSTFGTRPHPLVVPRPHVPVPTWIRILLLTRHQGVATLTPDYPIGIHVAIGAQKPHHRGVFVTFFWRVDVIPELPE